MEKDLTTGNITPQLIRFTIPLVLGNIFQLMYNAIDSIIVGRFVGSHALAAVGIYIIYFIPKWTLYGCQYPDGKYVWS